LSNLRRTAWSKPYGILVAPSTSTRASELVTPCICTRNSVLMRLAASLSPSPLVLHSASICIQKVQQSKASSNAAPCVQRLHTVLIGAMAAARPWTGGSLNRFPCRLTRLKLAGMQTSMQAVMSSNAWCRLAAVHAYLVYEDNGWRVLACQAEQLADKLLTLTHPLGDQVTRRYREEG